MVTFVATTTNYKDKFKTEEDKVQALEGQVATYDQRNIANASQIEQERKALMTQIAELQSERTKLAIAERKERTAKENIQIKFNTVSTAMTSYETTIDQANQTRDLVQEELNKSLAAVTKLKAQLNTSEADMGEMSVTIARLNATVKNLTETKVNLENKIAELTNGKNIAVEAAVTSIPDTANPAPAVAPANSVLRGVVTELTAQQNSVIISLGSVDGVTNNTVFHVTRGDEFICNVKITQVDTNKAAGIIELKMDMPKVGDTVCNRL